MLKNLLTLKRLKRLIDGVEKYVDTLYSATETQVDYNKRIFDGLIGRISTLEKKIKVMECSQAGHDYTKWERNEVHQWGELLYVVAVGTCEDCGTTLNKRPAHMKPAEKKRFIDMGILFKEDFPVKTKKK